MRCSRHHPQENVRNVVKRSPSRFLDESPLENGIRNVVHLKVVDQQPARVRQKNANENRYVLQHSLSCYRGVYCTPTCILLKSAACHINWKSLPTDRLSGINDVIIRRPLDCGLRRTERSNPAIRCAGTLQKKNGRQSANRAYDRQYAAADGEISLLDFSFAV